MEPFNYRTQHNPVLNELGKKTADFDDKYEWPVDLPARPGLNSTGKAITIRVNQFKVTGWPQKDVFQYDVSCFKNLPMLFLLLIRFQINIGNGGEAKGKVMAVWKSRAVQNRLAQFNPGCHHLLWDGNRLAWYAGLFHLQFILLTWHQGPISISLSSESMSTLTRRRAVLLEPLAPDRLPELPILATALFASPSQFAWLLFRPICKSRCPLIIPFSRLLVRIDHLSNDPANNHSLLGSCYAPESLGAVHNDQALLLRPWYYLTYT